MIYPPGESYCSFGLRESEWVKHILIVGRLATPTSCRARHCGQGFDFNIWPALDYRVEDLPGGSREIVIPTLVPGEEVTVSYLYFPPITADQINAGIKSEQGFARTIPVLLQRQYPRWFTRTAAGVMLIGIVALLYVAYYLAVMVSS